MVTNLSNIKKLKLKNFIQDNDEKFYFQSGSYRIEFFETYGARSKMHVQLWYIENDMAYLKEDKILDWELTHNTFVIRERTKEMWSVINKFYERYFNGE